MKFEEQINRMKNLMGIKENSNNGISMYIPESIDYKDVTRIYHPAKKYGAGNIRYVYVEDLWKYKEHDRRKGSAQSQENIDKIKESILQNGFTSGNELIMNYYYNDLGRSKAFVTEGNHRLIAAIELKMEYLPVRINAYRTDNLKGYTCTSYHKIDYYLCKQYGYYPSSVDASMIFDEDALVTGYLKGIDKI